MSPDSLCRCAGSCICILFLWVHAHLRCTKCSILLHLMDICFLPCICLWQISHIQTCLCVVLGPGFVSTSPAFIRSSASHLVGPHDRFAKKNSKSVPLFWGREVLTQHAQQFVTALTAYQHVHSYIMNYQVKVIYPGRSCLCNISHRLIPL